MNISLTPELEQYIKDKINGGMYTSASEVVRESLRIMLNYEDLQKQRVMELNSAISIGMKQLRAGQKVEGSVSRAKMKQIDTLP